MEKEKLTKDEKIFGTIWMILIIIFAISFIYEAATAPPPTNENVTGYFVEYTHKAIMCDKVVFQTDNGKDVTLNANPLDDNKPEIIYYYNNKIHVKIIYDPNTDYILQYQSL